MGGFGNEVGSFDWVSEEDGLAAIRRVRAAERAMRLEDLIRRREAGIAEEPEVYEDPEEYDPVLRWHCRIDE
jgi:hypothetical protein